jgi:hypothetical protein
MADQPGQDPGQLAGGGPSRPEAPPVAPGRRVEAIETSVEPARKARPPAWQPAWSPGPEPIGAGHLPAIGTADFPAELRREADALSARALTDLGATLADARAAARYEIVDVAPTRHTASYPTAINQLGQVAGYSRVISEPRSRETCRRTARRLAAEQET